jgi:hypothetical protein
VSGVVMLIILFILPDLMAHRIGGPYAKAIDKALDSIRIYSVALGVIGQGIGFLIVRGGDKFLRDAEVQLLHKKEAEKTDDPGKP